MSKVRHIYLNLSLIPVASSLMREPRKEKNAPGVVPQAKEPSGISTVRETLNWKLEKLPSVPNKKKF